MAKNNKKSWSNITVFDPHHRIERYAIYLFLALALLISGFVVSKVRVNHIRHDQLMKIDPAGATSSFSKTTSTNMTLGKTHLSDDGKSAYIPLTFNSTDNVGINANDYKVYVGEVQNKEMKYRVKGHLLMYGSNNRAVIVLNSPTKIANQPLALFILNLRKVSTVDSIEVDDAIKDGSQDNNFGRYDVAPFKINPGASDIHKHRRINADYKDTQEIYDQTFGSDDIKDVYTKIRSDKKKLKQYQSAAGALVERLENAGYDVPKNPAWLADSWKPDDAVNLKTGKTANGKNALTYEPESESNTNNYPDDLKNEDGTTTADEQKQAQKESDAQASDDSASSSSESSTAEENGENDNTDSDDTQQTDSATQWANLQDAWDNIEDLKRDIYVTQYTNLYRARRHNSFAHRRVSISNQKHFKQISKVEEDK